MQLLDGGKCFSEIMINGRLLTRSWKQCNQPRIDEKQNKKRQTEQHQSWTAEMMIILQVV